MAAEKMNRNELKVPLWAGDPSLIGGCLYETWIHMIPFCRHTLEAEERPMVAEAV